MALPRRLKFLLVLLFSPLYVVACLHWLVDTVYFENQWACQPCRADDDPSIKQQFLYFSVWSLWLSTAIFFGWACRSLSPPPRPRLEAAVKWVSYVGLPHIATVFVSYVYYVLTYPDGGFLDEDACHVMGRASVSKATTSDMGLLNIYLTAGFLSDLTSHWFSAPLMLLLLLSGELTYDTKVPYSTAFMAVLGTVVAIGQIVGSRVYCGDVWFNSGMSILINFVIHCILAGLHGRTCGARRTPQGSDGEADGGKEAVGDDVAAI